MTGQSIGWTIATAGLFAIVAGPWGMPLEYPKAGGVTPPDTLAEGWISQVTMDPIRVVVPLEMRIESVTMEPIRVVIPIAQSATETLEAPDR